MRILLVLWVLGLASSARAASWAQERRSRPWAEQLYDREEIVASKELAAIQDRIDRRELPKVQFDFDSAEIRPDSYLTLDLIADLVLKHPDLKIKITAHTCTIGSSDYNLSLSERRAKSVMDYLARRGVPPPSMRYRGAGYYEPIADNSTEAGRIRNRRVEFRVMKRDWRAVY